MHEQPTFHPYQLQASNLSSSFSLLTSSFIFYFFLPGVTYIDSWSNNSYSEAQELSPAGQREILILNFHLDFWLQGFRTVCEVNFPTFREMLWVLSSL
jgi:hypothetical protein